MNRRRIAVIALTLAGLASSLPAQAAVGHGAAGLHLTIANEQTAPCSTPDSRQCAAYQRKLLEIVQHQQLTGHAHATMADVGRHQLDALIASID